VRKELIMGKAKVWLDEGEMFGPEGEGFERFNIACPRPLLAEALERICTAVKQLD
jgi:cystathionine beta-lyase